MPRRARRTASMKFSELNSREDENRLSDTEVEVREKDRTHFFFSADPKPARPRITLAPHYNWRVWKPSFSEMVPPGAPDRFHRRFELLWLLHQVHLFSSRDYGVFAIYDLGKLAHFTTILP